MWSGKRDSQLNTVRPNFKNANISFYWFFLRVIIIELYYSL